MGAARRANHLPDEKVTARSSIRVAACDKRGGGQLSPVGQALHSRRPVMRTDVYVRRLHYGLVLCKLAVICLDPSGLCLTTGVPVGSMFNDGPTDPTGVRAYIGTKSDERTGLWVQISNNNRKKQKG